LYPGIRRIIERVPKELGKVDSKDRSLSRTLSGEVDPLTCLKRKWKKSPFFLSGFAYLVVPLLLERIQYSAISHTQQHSPYALDYYS
jgi:hypothetical protein